jgi:hypothetical protein
MEGSWLISHHGHFTIGSDLVPLYWRPGRPQSQSARVRNFSPPLGLDSRTVQPVSRRYSKLAIHLVLAHKCVC